MALQAVLSDCAESPNPAVLGLHYSWDIVGCPQQHGMATKKILGLQAGQITSNYLTMTVRSVFAIETLHALLIDYISSYKHDSPSLDGFMPSQASGSHTDDQLMLISLTVDRPCWNAYVLWCILVLPPWSP